MLIIYLSVFILGTLIGSFLNVLSLRWGTNLSIVTKRSHCPQCKKTLTSSELIPIFSFLWQRGRCVSCRARISFQYPLIETLTGLVFLLIFNFQFSIFNEFSISLIFNLLYFWTIFSILIAIAIYDFHHKIIPDPWVFAFIGLSFLGIFIFHISSFMFYVVAGPIIALFFFLIWFLSKGRAMGFGDVKLALGIGWFLGLIGGIYATLWAFWIGGTVAIFLLILKNFLSTLPQKGALFLGLKGLTIKSEIPFGPFLVLGVAVAFFLEWDFIGLKLVFELIF